MQAIIGNASELFPKTLIQKTFFRRKIQRVFFSALQVVDPFQKIKIYLILAGFVGFLETDLVQVILHHPSVVLVPDLLFHQIDQLRTFADRSCQSYFLFFSVTIFALAAPPRLLPFSLFELTFSRPHLQFSLGTPRLHTLFGLRSSGLFGVSKLLPSVALLLFKS